MRKAACFVSLIVLLLLPHRASALFQFRDGWTKLLLTPHPSASSSAISQIITDAGGTVLWDYGAFILVNVPVPQVATVTSRLAPLNVSVQSGLEERISLPGATFDPRVGIPQDIDPSQKTFSYPPGHQGLYVVQLIGPTVNTWWNEIQALGATIAVYVHENTYLVAATPEQAQHFADLPYVQFVDFLHPFEKGEDFSKLPASVRYDVNVGGVATATDSSDADVAKIAEAVNSRWAWSREIGYNIRVKGEDAARLARVPLVSSLGAQAISLPHVWAAMPRHAPAGSTIIISGEGFIKGASVTFGGVPSPRVDVLGGDRLRVQVPETTAGGPADLLVSVPTDQKQFFSGGSASAFNIDSPSRSTFKVGDLIAANTLSNRYIEGTDGGEMQWLDPQDMSLFVRRQSTLLDASTLFIDPKGNVIFVDRNAATQYDLMSEKSNAGPSFAAGASAVLFDRAGNAVVVRGNTIERRAANGSLTGSASLVSASGITSADLAADQCTLVYTMAKTIGAYDVCTFQPLQPIFSATKDQLSVRILPDDTLLAGDDTNTRVINTSGTVLATIAGGASALALSPDGSLA
ncbi:MAG TPA: IPT/TIG domain-containing protein, partial [Thermoanaerobaculia bacterium]|nr:IPT/TIG domain-containing protein [Thermoanaerobaculia bacterium]